MAESAGKSQPDLGKKEAKAPLWRFAWVCALLSVLVILSSFLIFFLRNSSRLDDFRARVHSLVEVGQFEEAFGVIDSWRAFQPDSLEPLQKKIDACLKAKRIPGAIEAAREVLKLDPGLKEVRERLALWLFLTGNLEEAERECQTCREGDPTRADLAILHADILQRLGENEKAAGILDGLLQGGNRSAQVLTLRGALYLESGQPNQAIPLLREALGQPGIRPEKTLHFLGLALIKAGEKQEAEKIFSQLRSQQTFELWEKYGRSDSLAYKISLAESLVQSGKAREALDLLKEVRAQSPGNPYIDVLVERCSKFKNDDSPKSPKGPQ